MTFFDLAIPRLRLYRTLSVRALLVIICFAVSCWAQSGVHTLQGKVIAPNGSQPQNPVRVTLTYGGRRIYETFTDLSGHFSFSGLAKGTYELIADGDDQTFEKTTVYAEVSAYGSAPQLFTQDIQLQPLRGRPVTRAAVVNAFTQAVPKQAAQLLERAQKLDAAGKRDEAQAQIRQALQVFPAYFEARLALGNHLLKDGHFNEAIAELDRAREINPNDERLYQSFGLIMLQQRNYPVAIAVFAEAERLNPTNPLNPLMRATALIHQASMLNISASAQAAADRKVLLTKAEEALTKASESSAGKMKADHLSLGLFYEMKGNAERAADELEEYLRKAPGAGNANEIREHVKELRSRTGP